MEKEIQHLLYRLKVEYTLLWILCIGLILFYETELLPQGILVGDAQTEYLIQVAGILLAVGLIPISLRMFSLSLTRYIRQLPLMQAMKSYRHWSEVRIGLLLTAALINISIYYTTLDTTGLLCAGMVMIASLFCVPGKERLLNELDINIPEA